MAQGAFFVRGKLSGRASLLDEQKVRIVSKAVLAAGLVDNKALDLAEGLEQDAAGLGQGHRTLKSCGAPLGRNVGQRRDQLAVVGLVITRLAGKASRLDAGRPVERVDHQPRIVRQRQKTGQAGIVQSLDACVLGEPGAGFVRRHEIGV